MRPRGIAMSTRLKGKEGGGGRRGEVEYGDKR